MSEEDHQLISARRIDRSEVIHLNTFKRSKGFSKWCSPDILTADWRS